MIIASAQPELKKVILDEVSSLERVMWALYSRFGIVHPEVVHLNSWKH